ncbi:MAG: hypothetical protein LKF34_03755 [Acidaminococcaceae bacterium]|jgi:hypothetical protein|nr:hypothetical protein [Acidaminococcaceae bacterium]
MAETSKEKGTGLAWLRILVDVAMLALFVALMHPRFTNMGNHARMAYVLCGVVVCHLLLNWRFFAAWGHGPWSRRRVLLTAVNVLLAAGLAVSMVSVKLIPKHTGFANTLGLPQGYMRLHVIAGWLTMFLVAVHLGLHGSRVARLAPQGGLVQKLVGLVWKLAALAGVAAALQIDLWQRATGVFPLLKAPVPEPRLYYVSVVLVLILVGTVTHYLVKKL